MRKINISQNKGSGSTQKTPPQTQNLRAKGKAINIQKNAQSLNQNINREDKKKSKKRFPWKILTYTFLVLVLFLSAGYGVFKWRTANGNNVFGGGSSGVEACNDVFNPKCWTEAFRPQLKQTEGKTNALIVGIDTRESGSGAGLANTDTIMLATFYHDTGDVRLISFPRDLYAPYRYEEDGGRYFSKINAIYNAGSRYAPDQDGMRVLEDTVKEITGEDEIHYNALVKLEGVEKAIDAIGGITVDVPEKVTDIYPYIELSDQRQDECRRYSGDRRYCVFTFEAGPNEMDGEEALIYSRMRKLSSDFERGRRQQQVVEGIKDKIDSEDKNPTSQANDLLSIYNSVSDYVEVDLDFETIMAALALRDEVNLEPLNIVLDPLFGGGGMIVSGEGSNYNFRDYTFSNIHEELEFIEENAGLYAEQAKIYAVNHTGQRWENDNPMLEIKNGDYWFIEVVTDTKSTDLTDKSGVIIVDYSEDNPLTISEILSRFEDDFNTSVQVLSIDEAAELGISRTESYDEEVGVYIFSTRDLAENLEEVPEE